MNIIYGNILAEKIREKLKEEVKTLKRQPSLAVILVGENPASVSYIKSKMKACKEVGITPSLYKLNDDINEKDLIEEINRLNNDNNIDGILVQLPLPDHIDDKRVLESIDPKKDVDGLHPDNVGKLFLKEIGFAPCTALGILEILKEMNAKIEGSQAVIVGRSKLVGLPTSKLLLDNDASVTICHSKTKNLIDITNKADILIVAIGSPKFITSEYIKEGAYVIDVGINRLEDGSLCGDVDFENVKEKCSAITPVPKGVGPMTVTMLLANTVKAYKMKEGIL